MLTFRSRAFDVLLGLWTAVFGLMIPVFMPVRRPGPLRVAARLWVRGALSLLSRVVGLGHVEINRANVPDRPCLIVCNHQSTWETLAMQLLFPDIAIVAKKELLRIPVFGWYLKRQPMITIDREVGVKALRVMVEGARAALAEGRYVLIFPEGTRKPAGTPIAFRRGVELIYATLDVPVLPVVVDSGRFWGIGSKVKRPGIITVSYLPAIEPGLPGAEMVARACEAMEAERRRLSA